MKKLKQFISSLSLLILLHLISHESLSAQQPVTVTVQLDSAGYLIGDYIGLTVTISHPYQLKMGMSDIAQRLSPQFEMIKQVTNDSIRQENFLTEQKKFLITTFDTGWLRIPSIIAHYETASGQWDSAMSDPLPVYVGTVAVDVSKDPRPIKPILIVKNEILWEWILTSGLMVAGGISFYFWYRIQQKRKKQKIKKVVPSKTPHQLAIENLRLLESEQLWQQGKVNQYYSRLTHILRLYIEQTLRVPALEITTIEMMRTLRKKIIDKGLLDQLTRDLLLADMVKFARMKPMNEEHERVMETIREFVERTKPEPVIETTTA